MLKTDTPQHVPISSCKFRMLDLFSGIGGFHYAAEQVWGEELEVVAHVEIDKFCQKVLKKHWPETPIFSDIKEFNGKEYTGTIDLICGGFPCQPYSFAGKRKGKEDDRALWPEMFRVIKETKPNWIIGENVAGFVNMGLEDCISDLESEKYEVQAFIIPACAVNAPHRRDRVWIVSNFINDGLYPKKGDASIEGSDKQENRISKRNDWIDANPNQIGWERIQQQPRILQEKNKKSTNDPGCSRFLWGENGIRNAWEVEPELVRVVDGVSDRLDRIKSLGNAIVPQVVIPIMQAIKEIELTTRQAPEEGKRE